MSFGALPVEAKMAAREEAEQRRLLYVGMTRARDLLVFSGGLTAKPARDSVLSLLQDAIGEESASQSSPTIEIGTGHMTRVIIPTSVSARGSRAMKHTTAVPIPVLTPILSRNEARRELWSQLRDTPRQLTPSKLADDQSYQEMERGAVIGEDQTVARLVGTCAHALLERWDFAGIGQDLNLLVDRVCRQYASPEQTNLRETVAEELSTIFASFLVSEPYRTLQRATILGREVPFVMPWGDGQIMEGVLDLIYRLDERIWIVDYKTDRISGAELESRAAHYRPQATVYTTAVTQALGEPVAGFQLIFLRLGAAVEL
jgi:ATP-dependent helicase/nuclease subunit A